MIPHSKYLIYTILLSAGLILCSCNRKTKKDQPVPKKDSSKTIVKKEKEKKPETPYHRPPIINIVDTLSPKRIVIYCNDSAATFERISLKLGKIYGSKLAEYLKKNNLKMASAPMAWYKKQKAPYFFEAGVAVNKKGTKPVKGVQVRELAAGKVVLAHFYGPYDLLPVGYDVIKDWIKDNKKQAAGAPYEIYVTDPVDKNGKPVDPYKVQTDIVFPIK